MKTIFATILLGTSLSTYALNCQDQPYDYKAKVGSISPKKARSFIETTDYSVDPGLIELNATEEEIAAALMLGLKFQKLGTESMIYNVDSLLSMIKNSSVLLRVLDTNGSLDFTGEDYEITLFQIHGTLRTIETLRTLGRDQEVEILEKYIGKVLDRIDNKHLSVNVHNQNANMLAAIRLKSSNTGRFSSKKKSIEMCELIKSLD